MEEIVPCDGLKCAQVLTTKDKVKSLNFSQKKQLVLSPRPTPDLCIHRIKEKRKFRRSVYKLPWITGCSHTNKLYCWCCILFGTSSISKWQTCGVDDLHNIGSMNKTHETSVHHLKALIRFRQFTKQQMETASTPHEEISKHNMLVDTNRSVFQRLIDIVCHLGQQEKKKLRDHDVLGTTNCLELVSLLSKYDPILEAYKCRDRVESSYLTNQVLKEIIHSVADVMRTRIESEIRAADFISITIEDTPKVSHRNQHLYLILRYFLGDGVHDYFWGFINESVCSTAKTLSDNILELLNKFGCTEKVVAQCYDGASAISELKHEVQINIKNVCPEALFVWSNEDTLVLSKLCNKIEEVSSFFSAVHRLCNFFNLNSQRDVFYKTHCLEKLPPASWMSVSQSVNTIFEQKSIILALLADMSNNTQAWDGGTVSAAKQLVSILKSFHFNFFLLVFHHLFVLADILHRNLLNSQMLAKHNIMFQSKLRRCMESESEFDKIYLYALQNSLGLPLRCNEVSVRTKYKRLFVQLHNSIYSDFHERYSELSRLKFFELFNPAMYTKMFLSDVFDSLFKTYGKHFDKDALKRQLTCLYNFPELNVLNFFEVIDFIRENGLQADFAQLFKLAHLLLTIPNTWCTAKQTISCYERIHTYVRNTQEQECQSDWAMIAINKPLLDELKRSPTFYSDVVTSFLKRDKRLDLQYR